MDISPSLIRILLSLSKRLLVICYRVIIYPARAGCSSIACREVKSDDQKVQSCNRSRCSANLYSKEKEQEKEKVRAKHIKNSHSRNSSTKLSTGNTSTRSTSHQANILEGTAARGAKGLNRNAKIAGDNLDCCSRRNENKQPKIMVKCSSIRNVPPEACTTESKDPPRFAGRIGGRLQIRASKQVMRQPRSGNQGSTKISSMSVFAELAAKRTSQGRGAASQNNGLKRNIKSSVRSEALPHILSPVDSGASIRVNDSRKRSSNRDSPSSRANNTLVSSAGGLSSWISTRRHSFMSGEALTRPRSLQANLAAARSRTIQEQKGKDAGKRQQKQADDSILTPALHISGNDSWNFQSEVTWGMDAAVEDDELTFEQDVELNSYSSSRHSYDEFRDLRMNIDDMSYEDLLALEERIGNVKTALTEEALSKCVHRANYAATCLVVPENTEQEEGDYTCSICQEDYALGEELGSLLCSHRYHLACIQEWFQLKNWCPICKTSMSPTN